MAATSSAAGNGVSGSNLGRGSVLPGERVQMRLVGTSPLVVAESRQLAFVLDPSGSAPGNASMTVRHGASPMLAVADSGDGGVHLSAGDGSAAALLLLSNAASDGSNGPVVSSYMSFRTPDLDARVGYKERLRVGPASVDVAVCATVARDLTVNGNFYATYYNNLVDNYTSASIVQPPTANALASAFRALSNLVVTHICSGGGGGGVQSKDPAHRVRSGRDRILHPLYCRHHLLVSRSRSLYDRR